VQVLGISANNPFSQKTFANSLDLPFPLLSDFPNLTTIKNYGVLRTDRKLSEAQRSFFIVDLDGVIRGQWRAANGKVFPNKSILEVVHKISKAM